MLTTGETVSPAERIIDDTCLVLLTKIASALFDRLLRIFGIYLCYKSIILNKWSLIHVVSSTITLSHEFHKVICHFCSLLYIYFSDKMRYKNDQRTPWLWVGRVDHWRLLSYIIYFNFTSILFDVKSRQYHSCNRIQNFRKVQKKISFVFLLL